MSFPDPKWEALREVSFPNPQRGALKEAGCPDPEWGALKGGLRAPPPAPSKVETVHSVGIHARSCIMIGKSPEAREIVDCLGGTLHVARGASDPVFQGY